MKPLVLIAVVAVGAAFGAYELRSFKSGSVRQGPAASIEKTTDNARVATNVDVADRAKNQPSAGDEYDRHPPDSGASAGVGPQRATASAGRSESRIDSDQSRVPRKSAAPAETSLPPAASQEVSAPVSEDKSPAPTSTETPTVTPGATLRRGQSVSQVQELFGAPALTYRDVWHYETRAGTLRVYFENGYVSQWLPSDFDFSTLATRLPVVTATTPVRPRPPGGAIARCADGTYVLSAHPRGLCFGHGGLDQDLRK